MKNQHRTETLSKNYETGEMKRSQLMSKIEEKNHKSEKAKERNEGERRERQFREFIQGEDKKFNVQRIASQQEYERELLNDRIHRDDLRSERIKMEREEIMHAKQRLRREIDKDKQNILQDFEQIKQGKVEPSEVAKKYGYVARPQDDQSRMSHSHMPSINNKGVNNVNKTSSQSIRQKPAVNASHGQDHQPSNANNSAQKSNNVVKQQQDRGRELEEIKRKHNQELLNMIEQERTKEDQRERELRECKDEKKKADLEAQYGYQRAEAQQKITQIMSRHKSELNRYTN